MVSELGELRQLFHVRVLAELLTVDEKGVPSNADKDSKESREIAVRLQTLLGAAKIGKRLPAQTAGRKFESVTHSFVRDSFALFVHLRPGRWQTEHISSRQGLSQVARFSQYQHLLAIQAAARSNRELAVALGNDYVIAPDIVISRLPEPDSIINVDRPIVDANVGALSALRQRSDGAPIMHASISCKWTIRSDRSQNSRSESLNLLRNRKGRAPHIAVVTAEPLPQRIASIALGTGDIDCIYHFALAELRAAVSVCKNLETVACLEMLVEGKRLKDIADLPLDLTV